MFIHFANLYINMYVEEQREKITYSLSEKFLENLLYTEMKINTN